MVIEESILPLNDPRTFLSIDSTFMIYQLQGTTHTRNMLLLTYSEVLICYQHCVSWVVIISTCFLYNMYRKYILYKPYLQPPPLKRNYTIVIELVKLFLTKSCHYIYS